MEKPTKKSKYKDIFAVFSNESMGEIIILYNKLTEILATKRLQR